MHLSNPSILVSVIIPVYNVEKYISEAIESVLNQTYKDIEIILVDDGSIDNSLSICKQFAQQNQNIKLIEQQNSGVSIARNNGLSVAVGEYVFFMDSDDTIDAEFIRTSHEVAKAEDANIVIVGDYYCKLTKVSALPTCAQFLKHDFLKQHPTIRFPEKIQPCEDGLFSHQLLALTDKIAKNPLGIYNYREHENQNHITINKNKEQVLYQIPKWLEILENFYTQNNLYQTKALHLALFLEHEPFELRFLAMPFDTYQKQSLQVLIKEFYTTHVAPFISNTDIKKLSKPFLQFLKANDVEKFEKYYRKHVLLLKIKEKLHFFNYKAQLKMVNIIPISKYRKYLRNRINANFAK
ncbi:MAG: glycosyl transferase family 2 [Flavobacterium sp.]|uniref:glycosyltransferase family 2 protein n=1 Tax=Flavobacterium sp. TaxID=239 RepID=UPI000C66FB5B|nr:glycosyltransferase family 2 protein [Flavobacterium sp.]MBF04307.1 glycosyl transferase family 2 [Flavobacterium sp.]|tara:strand:- start:5279 stop:6334 length:1056 start_codon:yes stop_codon:yes gene_type:complete